MHIVSGDADFFDGAFRINAEGVLVVNGSPSSSNRWVQGMATATVTDGRLTVTSAAGAINNKICFIDVAQVPGLASSATPAFVSSRLVAPVVMDHRSAWETLFSPEQIELLI